MNHEFYELMLKYDYFYQTAQTIQSHDAGIFQGIATTWLDWKVSRNATAYAKSSRRNLV